MTAKKCTKKRGAHAELLFWQSKPTAFTPFSLMLPSSLLKLPNVSLKGAWNQLRLLPTHSFNNYCCEEIWQLQLHVLYGTRIWLAAHTEAMHTHSLHTTCTRYGLSTLNSGEIWEGMFSCFPRMFARLANIGSVAKAKQSLNESKCRHKSFERRQFRLHVSLKVTRPRYFARMPSKFEAPWYHHFYLDRKFNI